jgi:peptidylprolyl isomerase
MPRRFSIAGLIALAVATNAVAQEAPRPTPPFKIGPGSGVTSLPSGLQYIDSVPGKGEKPNPGDICIVHYTVWTEEGTELESSLKPRPRDPKDPSKGEAVRPFGFRLGAGQVLKGWDEGIATMREGGTRLLFLPPNLAYGERGLGNAIKPNSRLTFKIQLVKIKREGQATPPAAPAKPAPGH